MNENHQENCSMNSENSLPVVSLSRVGVNGPVVHETPMLSIDATDNDVRHVCR